jgi:hypothetical protein
MMLRIVVVVVMRLQAHMCEEMEIDEKTHELISARARS